MSSSQIYFNQNFDSLRSFASPENDLISVVVEMWCSPKRNKPP